MLSSSANMFHTSIVTTLYHSQILIWIRLCHVQGLRKWGFSFSLFSPHSFSFPLSLSHLHAASSQALWCACFNLELNGICGTAVPIGGKITDPRVHCGMPPFWWVGVKIAVKQWRRACSPRRETTFPMQNRKRRSGLLLVCFTGGSPLCTSVSQTAVDWANDMK